MANLQNVAVQEEKLYSVPMVQPPSIRELEIISDQFGLGIAEEAALLQTYKATVDGIVAEINKIEGVVEPCLPVKYPRTPGYRPSQSENPHNAWYFKSTIHGAECGILNGKRVAMKDMIAVAGMPMMMGSNAVGSYVPDFDATVVTRVLDAGGEILGKATCEDLCYSGESFTSATGPVLNPVNTKHSAGGSSSGCAVLVQNNDVDMAIGGDQGGSIRIPASYCGIVGLKPTFGLVPYTGAAYFEFTLDHLGPMTRTVEDCALMLQALAGYDDGKDGRQPVNLTVSNYSEKLKELDPKELRVGVLSEGFGFPESNPKTDQLIRDALAHFAKATGAKLQEVSIPLHRLGNAIEVPIEMVGSIDPAIISGGGGLGHAGYYATSMMQTVATTLRANRRKLNTVQKATVLCGQYMKDNYVHVYGKAQNLRRLLTKAYDDILDEWDVVAMPTIPFTAPPLPMGELKISDFDDILCNMTLNVVASDLTGHPSISIPAGTVGGLPVGLMLTGKKFGEEALLRAAYAFERFLNTNPMAI